MVYVIESLAGSDLSGSSGQSSRTYVLSNIPPIEDSIRVVVSNYPLMRAAGDGYSYDNTTYTITFNSVIFDDQNIEIQYQYSSESVETITTSNDYCTTLEVFDRMNWVLDIPDHDNGEHTLETVDSSGTLTTGSVIYLDHTKVIDSTYTIYYGADANTVYALVDTDDYSIDLDIGKITLTAAGATKIGSNNVYAEYSYNKFRKDSVVSDMIQQAEDYIDDATNQSWQSLTTVIREEHIGQGEYDRLYRVDNMPVYLVKTQIATAIDDDDTTLIVDSTTGFVGNSYVSIGTEIVKIYSVDSTTQLTIVRGQYGSTAVAHAVDDYVVNVVVEISSTPLGTEPTYTILQYKKDYDIDSTTGCLQLQHVEVTEYNELQPLTYPGKSVFGRLRIIYQYGTSIVPSGITKLCILIVCRDLLQTSIAKATAEGNDSFTPQAQGDIDKEIDRLLAEYAILLGGMI